MSKKSRLTTALVALLALGTGIAGTAAYFTSTETVENKFTVGNVTIDVEEPNWNEDDAKDFVPNKELPKDPTIENTGDNDAYVYFEVVVPTADGIIVADEDGTRQPQADDVELWTYEINAGWTQLSRTVNDGNVTYVYYANDALAAGATSAALFDTVKMANVIEGQGLEDSEHTITVKGMAIQTETTGTAQEAYAKYINQNK